ncbi:SSI family serine proteinase inhibitor [Amycolatopsis nigrescens]|uniref:SSI family serine proteinase inhibitor n=1 Tax=Amycolatopsis nigrescens TaxID=381445 RepID=UPI000364852A|nr:SSI family serine proteinase inhibitor [Amycolatopsis nigrescens]
MAFLPFEPITACALTLACLGAPAQPADTSLSFSMNRDNGATSSVSLSCEPSGGSHPTSDAACETLKKVNGDFSRLPVAERACVLIYAPVNVEVTGSWRGKPVSFQREYPNTCVASAESTDVFTF